MKFALLTIALATAQLLAAQRVTMRLPPDETEQYYLVSFDQSRASAKDVEHWMKFSENGYYNAGVSLSGCDKSAARRMRNDWKATRRISDQLDSEVYPPQLSAVVAYLKRQLKLQLWLGEQEIRLRRPDSCHSLTHTERPHAVPPLSVPHVTGQMEDVR